MIQVNKTDIIERLAKVNKGSIFPGFAQIPGTPGPNGTPPTDNTALFVTVTPDAKPTEEVSISFDVDFSVVATRAARLKQITDAAGEALPLITTAVMAPSPGTIVNGLQVVTDQILEVLRADYKNALLELSFPAIPVRNRKARETYEISVFANVALLLNDRKPAFLGGNDGMEFAVVSSSLLASRKPARNQARHAKGAEPLEESTLTMQVDGITNADPFEVQLNYSSQASTDGGGDNPPLSLARISNITVVIRAVPMEPVSDTAKPGQAPDANPNEPGEGVDPGHETPPNGQPVPYFLQPVGPYFLGPIGSPIPFGRISPPVVNGGRVLVDERGVAFGDALLNRPVNGVSGRSTKAENLADVTR